MFLQNSFYSKINSIDWLQLSLILVTTLITYTTLQTIKSLLLQKLIRIDTFKKNNLIKFLIDLLNSFHWPFYLALSLAIVQQWLSTPPKIESMVNQLLMIIFSFYFTLSVNQFIKHSLDKYTKENEKLDSSVINVIKKIIQAVTWIITSLFVLQNLGYEVSTLIGGLGIAGVSVAFGVKNILEDVLSYFSISFDKPFQTGDYIVLGEDSGNVKKIGLKSTRIKTLRGEELIVSNKELTQSRIRNFKKMNKRRDSFEVKVGIKTSEKKLQQLKKKIQQIIETQEKAEFDRVYFSAIENGAFIFSVTYYLAESDYETFAHTKESINFSLVKYLQENDIRLATNIPIVQNSN